MVFSDGEITLSGRLIEGNYPDYEQILPTDNPIHLVADRAAFLTAVRRVSLFSDPSTARIQLAIDHDSIDPLCLICKAGDLDRSLFVTLAVLRNAGRSTSHDALRDAKEFGRIYDSITDRDAQRALRFMMLRRNAA